MALLEWLYGGEGWKSLPVLAGEVNLPGWTAEMLVLQHRALLSCLQSQGVPKAMRWGTRGARGAVGHPSEAAAGLREWRALRLILMGFFFPSFFRLIKWTFSHKLFFFFFVM